MQLLNGKDIKFTEKQKAALKDGRLGKIVNALDVSSYITDNYSAPRLVEKPIYEMIMSLRERILYAEPASEEEKPLLEKG